MLVNMAEGPVAWESVARAWERHERQILAPREQLNNRLVELCGLRAGHKLLDFGTGVGEPALTAARLHPDCEIFGADVSPVMLKVAANRAQKLGLKNFFPHHVAGSLPFSTKLFDAAISSFAVEFSPQPEADFKEIGRTVKDKGILVVSNWSCSLELNPVQCLVPATIREVAGDRALTHDVLFRFERIEKLLQLAEPAGFVLKNQEHAKGSFQYESISDFWQLKKFASPMVVKDFSGLEPQQIAEVEKSVNSSLLQWQDSNGCLFLPWAARISIFEHL